MTTSSNTASATSITSYVNFTDDEVAPPTSPSIGRNANNYPSSNSTTKATNSAAKITSVTKDAETSLLSQKPLVTIADDTEEQQRGSYNDKTGLILFVLHVLTVLTIATYYISSMMNIRYNEEFLERYDEAIVVEYWDNLLPHFAPWYLTSVLLNIFLIITAMKFILDSSICAKFLIRASILDSFLYIGTLLYCIVCSLVGKTELNGLALFWILHISLTIDGGVDNYRFATTMIEIATTLMPTRKLIMIICYSYVSLFVAYLWLYLLWKTLVAGFFISTNSNVDDIDISLFVLLVFFYFSSFWMFWVLRHIVLFMANRIVGSLCLSSSPTLNVTRTSPPEVVHGLYQRNVVDLLGSICIGWLIDVKCKFVNMCSPRERFIYSNWVYIFVSMDGSNYETAEMKAKTLRDTNARLSFVSINTYLHPILIMYSVDISMIARFIGLISAMYVVAMIFILDPPQSGNKYMVFGAFVPMLIGYSMAMSIFSIISTIIRTLSVCYCRFPNEFQMNNPTIFARMTDVFPQCNRPTENATTTTTTTITASSRNNAGTTELV